jgi:acyl-homoserine-lactone acylase
MLQAEAGKPKNEILFDSYGIPHIFARSVREMYYGFGWAQMRNHANLMLKLYGQARGRGAEYWGERYLSSDKQVQLFRLPEMAGKTYSSQDSSFRMLLDAFVKGVNAYAHAHLRAIDEANRPVLPITAEDVIAHGMRVIFLRFVAGRDLGMGSRQSQAGSNSYAIAPSRSADGHALLLANPHLPWSDLYTFFEAQLQAPGFNAYGVTIVGLPVLNIAFNDHLGWTHTVNPIDACDRYELTVRGDSYLLDGALEPFVKRSVTLKVRQPDGAIQQQTVELRYSRHGPVIESRQDRAYAIRIAGMENHDIFYQWHRMAAARDWPQFEAALHMMQLPMLNVIYADQQGNIFYLFDGNIPLRSEGDWKFWNGIVDGRSARLIWEKTLPYDSLPKLMNPATGFIQNANDPPWSCTFPVGLDPHAFPAYISPTGMSLRAQRAVHILTKEDRISLDKLADCKLNTGMEAADRLLNDLLAAARSSPDTLVSSAVSVLSKWDKATNADSRGAVLFARWFDKLGPGMFARPWSPDNPLETPAGLKDPAAVVELLKQAATEVIGDYGSLDIAWGDVYRFRLDKLDYPANGGPEQYGIYRTIYYARDRDGKFRSVAGDSYTAAIEFGKDVKAMVLLSYGNASEPWNKHTGDQLLLLSRKQWREAWLTRKDILRHLEEKDLF